MPRYTLVMTTTTAALPWRYDFTEADDARAEALAGRILTPRSIPEGCMSVALWGEGERLIARFRLAEPRVERMR